MTVCAQRIVYITAGNREEAVCIGRVLVEERLAACVNILGEIESLYRWEGAVQQDKEFAFIAKTMEDKVEALAQRVAELHSYETPCIVALLVDGGSRAFLGWIGDAVGAAPRLSD